jgi:hypothetical protein
MMMGGPYTLPLLMVAYRALFPNVDGFSVALTGCGVLWSHTSKSGNPAKGQDD